MLVTSSTPVFPVELFNSVIDHLGHRAFESGFSQGQLDTLRSCALVCKAFNDLCRFHIFGYVDFSTSASDSTAEKEAILCFINAMERDDALKTHVRELKITFMNYFNSGLTDQEIERWTSVLLSFPNLRNLDISRDLENTDGFPAPAVNLGSTLAKTYLKRGMLRSIHLRDVDGLSFGDVLLSPVLQGVELIRTELTNSTLQASHSITSFKVDGVRELPLSVLCVLPNLQHLEIADINMSILPGDQHIQCPTSWNLRTLCVDPCGPTRNFFDFFHSHATGPLGSALGRLEVLKFSPKVETDLEDLCTLLEQTPSLRTLNINVLGYRLSTEFSLAQLHLPQRILTTFPSLKTLHLEVETRLDNNRSSVLFKDMVELFASIACNTVLETLTIKAYTHIVERRYLPTLRPWYQLSSLLSDASAFPCLNAVAIHLCLKTSNVLSNFTPDDQFSRSAARLHWCLLVAFNEVASRDGMKFEGHVSVCLDD